VQLEGAINFRSLGGMRSRDGRSIAPHRLLRSGRLDGLSAQDWMQLREVGLGTVCDLRGTEERQRNPNGIPQDAGITDLWLEVRNDIRTNPVYFRMLAAKPTPQGAVEVMETVYRGFAAAFAEQLAPLARALVHSRAPFLVQCSAGKDRTGFVIALVLSALDVPQRLIVEDYLRSAPVPDETRLEEMARNVSAMIGVTVDGSVIEPLLDARASYLEAAMRAIEAEWGSVLSYWERAGALNAGNLAALRARWLT
jgi:protein-tyrosine phosphatase